MVSRLASLLRIPMSRTRQLGIGMLLAGCLWIAGCNDNELEPVITVVPADPNDLLEISESEITSTFGATTRQTIQFTTSEAEANVANMYFYASHDLTSSHSSITNIIFSVHGLSARDANVRSEYNGMVSSVSSTTSSASTMVISPHFFHKGLATELDWNNAVWRAGGKVSSPVGGTLSSSQIVDYMLTEFLLENANFPNLSNVIIAGHSAGGQFVQRYAAISEIEEDYPAFTFSYLPANASHFVYLNTLRWDGNGTYTPFDCPTYNDYPYGLDNLAADSRYAFISKIGLETIRGHFNNRKVYYVLGIQDVTGATTDCESLNQQGGSGASRYLRGQYLLQFMNNQYPTNEHEILSVAGVGHNATGIYTSSEYVQLLNTLLD